MNLLFTLLTLGVYSAWAKVRKKKYFYGSTRLDGDTFDYFGEPRSILKGRILALVLFVIYAVSAELYPDSKFAFWAVALLLLPWLVVRAFTFNARNSAWRGLRFDFPATTAQAARVYLGNMALCVVTLGLAFPWFMARQKAFLASHHAFGTTRFECELSGRTFFSIYFRAGLIVSAVALLVGVFAAVAVPRLTLAGASARYIWLAPIVVIYAGYVVAYAYTQARTSNLFWANTRGEGVRFESTLRAAQMIRLYFGNILAVALSAGLLIPWAVVRTLRYRLDSLTMIVDKNIVHAANPALAPVGAAGQELGDMFNLDLGL